MVMEMFACFFLLIHNRVHTNFHLIIVVAVAINEHPKNTTSSVDYTYHDHLRR
jgi:hypothetical protein